MESYSKRFDPNESINFWNELDFVDLSKLNVTHWGSASIPVPNFFKECIVKAATEMSIQDFQYT
jgi:hypothetical protein